MLITGIHIYLPPSSRGPTNGDVLGVVGVHKLPPNPRYIPHKPIKSVGKEVAIALAN